jgi:hypothetical protein
MKRRLSRRLAELWSEIDEIFGRLTSEEIEWFTLFLRAYYCGDKEALKKLCGENEALYHEIRQEVTYMSHASRRMKDNPKRKRKRYSGDYGAGDYMQMDSTSPEDAYLDAIDNGLSFKEFN